MKSTIYLLLTCVGLLVIELCTNLRLTQLERDQVSSDRLVGNTLAHHYAFIVDLQNEVKKLTSTNALGTNFSMVLTNSTAFTMFTNGLSTLGNITNILINTNPPGWIYGWARNKLEDDGTNNIWDRVLISTNNGTDIIFKGEYKTEAERQKELDEEWIRIMKQFENLLNPQLEKPGWRQRQEQRYKI